MKLYAEIDIQNRIKPLYNSDYDTLKKVKKNTPLRIEIVNERNWEFHKKAFALFNLGFENQEWMNNFDYYRKIMTMKAGYFDTVITDKGEVYFAKSISYASMKQYEFEQFFNSLLDVISKELDSKPDDIRAEVLSFY